eukprot:1677386-Alexandrium_andersonii.AAC.1
MGALLAVSKRHATRHGLDARRRLAPLPNPSMSKLRPRRSEPEEQEADGVGRHEKRRKLQL